MTSRLARLCLIVASSGLVSQAWAQTPPPLPTNPATSSIPAATPPGVAPEDDLVSLTLPDVDIDTILSALEIYTDRIVLRPQQLPAVTYNLNFKKKRIPRSEAILAIETVLALNNIGIAPLGDKFLKVVALNMVKSEAPEMITGSALDRPASGKVATKMFQLEFLRVAEFLPLVQNILNPFYGQPMQLQNANAMLVTDSVSNLQRVEQLLQQVDRPITAGMKPKFYNVRNVKASELVNKLRTILQGTLQNQLGQATTYSADDRTQQIVIVTDPRQWEFFTELIERLDQKSDPNTRNDVIYLKHAKAKDVTEIITRVFMGQKAVQGQNTGSVRPGTTANQLPAPGAPPQPVQPSIVSGSAANNPNAGDGANEFSAYMTVVNDERSNSVVIFGTSDDIRLVRDLVEKLDIVLAQVRIEVVIAEVSISDNNQTGISALGLKLDGDKLVGFSGGLGGSPPTVTIANGTITRPGASGHMDLAAEISIGTTPRKSNNTIVTHPSVVTSHGKEAKIFNGETRPVVTGTVSAAGATTTGLSTSSQVTQQQIGTTLTVTPFIGIDGSVNLDVTQSVEDVTGEVLVDQNKQYVISRRETKSNISAKSGDILVFAGYQKQTDTKSTSRLGPIPILGDIFGARSKQKAHSELIFFLRPTVLTNNPLIDNADTMKQIEKFPTKDEIKTHLDPSYISPKPSILDRILPK